VQVKKPEIREAILAAAFELFSSKGYASTTLPQIAQRAGVSTTNLYIYFESKLTILYAVHGPWIQREFKVLEAEVEAIADPRGKLRHLFTVLFRELPAREGGFANNIIQGIATARPEDPYRPALMVWLEDRLLAMVSNALPGTSRELIEQVQLSHFLMMAFDGYIVFHQVAPNRGCSDATIEFLCDLMLSASAAKRKTAIAKEKTNKSPGKRRASKTQLGMPAIARKAE
jgi:AcrR family transcriptional regulator